MKFGEGGGESDQKRHGKSSYFTDDRNQFVQSLHGKDFTAGFNLFNNCSLMNTTDWLGSVLCVSLLQAKQVGGNLEQRSAFTHWRHDVMYWHQRRIKRKRQHFPLTLRHINHVLPRSRAREVIREVLHHFHDTCNEKHSSRELLLDDHYEAVTRYFFKLNPRTKIVDGIDTDAGIGSKSRMLTESGVGKGAGGG